MISQLRRQPDLSGRHGSPGGVYMNFLEGSESQERIRDGLACGGCERLARLKAKFDPDNVLRYSFNIAPDA